MLEKFEQLNEQRSHILLPAGIIALRSMVLLIYKTFAQRMLTPLMVIGKASLASFISMKGRRDQ